MAIDLQAAIAVFDKSADRTRPNVQTEAWAVIRAELMRVMGAPAVELVRSVPGEGWWINGADNEAMESAVERMIGQRVRLVREVG